jgi:hypothetical protein
MVKGDKAIKTNNNSDAYMPDTSTSTRTGADQKQDNYDIKIKESVEKGDVDGVVAAILERQLAE